MQLIAIDLDGTLLSSDGTISTGNRQAIRDAQSLGHIVVISSGRSLHDTKELLDHAGLDCPIITGNGAVAFHSGEVIQHLQLPVHISEEMMELAERYHLYYEVYTNEGVYIEENGRNFLEQEARQLYEKTGKPEPDEAAYIIDTQHKQRGLSYVPNYRSIDYDNLGVYKIFVLTFDPEKLKNLRQELSGRVDISITTSGVQKLEVGNPQSTKGNALSFIADYFGVSPSETVAIGDNLNDLSMFEVAGTSIAMENAELEVKEAADHMTKDHNQDGVAYGLYKWVLT
ncbi:Cof-type HAD-IIB family hydrolase [Virgibacillus xinjiangensis]|uniref:Cof-type HAD-IIB family hydrolase n=1 Tax=Virgibacillus xinjiangensis TaxID=393090 RepID=A0ABV7D0P9_9BACI